MEPIRQMSAPQALANFLTSLAFSIFPSIAFFFVHAILYHNLRDFTMSETNNKIPFSTIRREIRKIMRKPQEESAAFPAVDFVPCDLKIWTGKDSDFFLRSSCHHRMILKIILAGNASTNIDGVRYRLKPSDAVLYFPMQTHSTETPDDGVFEYLAISFVAGMGDYKALDVLKNRVFHPDPENRFLLELLKAWSENRQVHAAYLLAELLSFAVSRFSVKADCDGGEFGDIAEYIRQNCQGELSVKKIASEFEISPQSPPVIVISAVSPG
jgi:hypothetical protein